MSAWSMMITDFFCWGNIFILLSTLLLIVIYVYMKNENEYFAKNGINGMRTYFPFVGNTFNIITNREHLTQLIKKIYNLYPDEKYFGYRNFNQPFVVIRDLDLIKQLTIKDFDHFIDHIQQMDESIDPVLGNTLISLKGQKWRDMRTTLSPAFTSSKMRGMFEFVNECGDEMAKYLMQEFNQSETKDKNIIELEMRDTFTRYTNDVIATSAFGIRVNSLKEKDNTFYTMGKQFTNVTALQMLKFIMILTIPNITRVVKIELFSPEIRKFFKSFLHDTIKTREEQHIVRPDMIHLLMEAKKGNLKHEGAKMDNDKDAGFATVEEADLRKSSNKRDWTDNEMSAQAAIFFFGGFETTSSVLCLLAYELARNPDIQKRLQEEVDEVSERNDGALKYDDLLHMKYMDMVVSETLRRWPPLAALDRKCVQAYTLPPSNEHSKTNGKINVGDGIWIPVYGIHHDPKYYKNPEVFDPERFSDGLLESDPEIVSVQGSR